MTIRFSRLVTLVVLAAPLACASSGTAASTSGSRASSQAARSPNVISAQEIAQAAASNAYDLVMRLRPQWLRSSGVASIGAGARQGSIIVLLDNVRMGGMDNLRSISSGGITSIQYFNAEQAASRFPENGGGLVAGAIAVSTK